MWQAVPMLVGLAEVEALKLVIGRVAWLGFARDVGQAVWRAAGLAVEQAAGELIRGAD